jgi:hypothetical protein
VTGIGIWSHLEREENVPKKGGPREWYNLDNKGKEEEENVTKGKPHTSIQNKKFQLVI